MSKIVVVGANHAGRTVLSTQCWIILKRKMKLLSLTKTSNISFLGCGMALWIGEQIDGPSAGSL